MKLRNTRFPPLKYCDYGHAWRVVDTSSDNAPIGPYYTTRAELLADLPRFAHDFGVNPFYLPQAVDIIRGLVDRLVMWPGSENPESFPAMKAARTFLEKGESCAAKN